MGGWVEQLRKAAEERVPIESATPACSGTLSLQPPRPCCRLSSFVLRRSAQPTLGAVSARPHDLEAGYADTRSISSRSGCPSSPSIVSTAPLAATAAPCCPAAGCAALADAAGCASAAPPAAAACCCWPLPLVGEVGAAVIHVHGGRCSELRLTRTAHGQASRAAKGRVWVAGGAGIGTPCRRGSRCAPRPSTLLRPLSIGMLSHCACPSKPSRANWMVAQNRLPQLAGGLTVCVPQHVHFEEAAAVLHILLQHDGQLQGGGQRGDKPISGRHTISLKCERFPSNKQTPSVQAQLQARALPAGRAPPPPPAAAGPPACAPLRGGNGCAESQKQHASIGAQDAGCSGKPCYGFRGAFDRRKAPHADRQEGYNRPNQQAAQVHTCERV